MNGIAIPVFQSITLQLFSQLSWLKKIRIRIFVYFIKINILNPKISRFELYQLGVHSNWTTLVLGNESTLTWH